MHTFKQMLQSPEISPSKNGSKEQYMQSLVVVGLFSGLRSRSRNPSTAELCEDRQHGRQAASNAF